MGFDLDGNIERRMGCRKKPGITKPFSVRLDKLAAAEGCRSLKRYE